MTLTRQMLVAAFSGFKDLRCNAMYGHCILQMLVITSEI